ncbi:hypothetical protein FHW84_001806 [Dyella sp. SG562]|uniref:hypothetical protein n=1 Tax=Dyella sp. SG562 TaxID=2587017 RepID=UPI001423045A|nr:hypothetical protein [Dyella sp. SG562]NII73237.1 hypothetical protein [Dyella sp. SG562]
MSEQGDYCLICSVWVEQYVPIYCCGGGFDCGCMGQPTNPCVCSEECGEALFDINGSYEDRRIRYGIPDRSER